MKISINHSDAIRPRGDLGVEPVADGLLILDKRNQKIHQLNSTAGAVWTSIQKGHEPKSITRKIVEFFDVSPQEAAKDVTRILEEFNALNLLEARDSR